MKSIADFIEGELFLKVNKDKSQVAPLSKIKFLGYSFYKKKRWRSTASTSQKCIKDESEDKGA